MVFPHDLVTPHLQGFALCMHKKLEGPTVFEILENALQVAISDKRVPEERDIKLLIAQMHVVMVRNTSNDMEF